MALSPEFAVYSKHDGVDPAASAHAEPMPPTALSAQPRAPIAGAPRCVRACNCNASCTKHAAGSRSPSVSLSAVHTGNGRSRSCMGPHSRLSSSVSSLRGISAVSRSNPAMVCSGRAVRLAWMVCVRHAPTRVRLVRSLLSFLSTPGMIWSAGPQARVVWHSPRYWPCR